VGEGGEGKQRKGCVPPLEVHEWIAPQAFVCVYGSVP
jgi:hypothetical protein